LSWRAAGCFIDRNDPALIEHSLATLVGQRIFGLALGYEDLNDPDALRRDPLFAVLASKLKARRADCAPVAGKSTLDRLEQSKETPTLWSLCTLEVEPAGEAVKLTVTHAIEREDSKFIGAVSGGWPQILSNLESLLETGSVVLGPKEF